LTFENTSTASITPNCENCWPDIDEGAAHA